ncbi:MAG TPA: NBR1-Ig-like domain-containing protein [Anaerolineales bacterium]|nr:NBR1-Ig-like domain-containing protein [Anaerolineales bacterium]
MKTKLFMIAWIGMLLLISCAPAQTSAPTPDVAFIKTAAAQTVVANFTLTAESASTPTAALLDTPTLAPTSTMALTPAPTQTSRPGAIQTVLCDAYSWDDTTVDVNIPDNTQMTAGQSFVKTWKIKNSGTCTWGAGYKISYAGYDTQMSGQPQPLPLPVAPGQEIEISVNFIAPAQAGSYTSAWTLDNGNGTAYSRFYGSNVQGTAKAKPLYVKIVVK